MKLTTCSLWLWISLVIITVFMPRITVTKTVVDVTETYDTTKQSPAECTFDPPVAKPITSSTLDYVQWGGDLVLSVGVAVSGLKELGPVAGIIKSAWSLGFSGAAVFGEDDSDQEIYDTMLDMFDTLWDCTVYYVQAIQDDIMEASFKQYVISPIKDQYNNVMIAMDTLHHKYNNDVASEIAADVRAYYLDTVEDNIDDYVDEFPWELLDDDTTLITEQERSDYCRSLLPFISTALNVKIILFTHYLNTYSNIDEWDDLLSFTDYHYAQRDFRNENAKLLSMWNLCAPYALKGILLDSDSTTPSEIAQELDVLYNGELFCSWVNITYYLTVNNSDQHSYQFNEINTYGIYSDFSYFADCNQEKWEKYVSDQYQSIFQDIMVDYKLKTNQLWTKSSPLKIDDIQRKVFCGNGEDLFEYNCPAASPWNDAESLSLSYGELKGNLILKPSVDCYGCTEYNADNAWDKSSLDTITETCSADSMITGARYLVYHDGKYESMHIGGVQFICSDAYQTWSNESNRETHFLQIDNKYDDDYAWSKFYICPSGYYLSLAINDLTECNYRTNEIGSDWDCWIGEREKKWQAYTTKANIAFNCLSMPSFIGCYQDDASSRAMQYGPYSDLTLNECSTKCKNKKYFAMAGPIGNPGNCYCDDDTSYKKYGKAENCNLPYGGYRKLAVYLNKEIAQ